MKVLIVENNPYLRQLWAKHLGHPTTNITSQADAVEALRTTAYDVVILNLDLRDGSTMAVSDFASYRRPHAKIIYVTSDSFFSDGLIFNTFGNACAMVPPETPPADMAAIVDYHGTSHAHAAHPMQAAG